MGRSLVLIQLCQPESETLLKILVDHDSQECVLPLSITPYVNLRCPCFLGRDLTIDRYSCVMVYRNAPV